MNWIDIRVRKPTQKDAESSGRVICLLENGDTTLQFWDKVFIGQTSAVAWLDPKTLPKFTPIPDPPEGYRFKQDGDERIDKAMCCHPDKNEWILVNPHVCDWLDNIIYAVPIDPPKSAIGEGYRSADYRDKDRVDVEYWDSFRQKWSRRMEIKIGDHFDPSLSYRVPIDSFKPQYRPFASFEEWWPHRERWVKRPEDGCVFRKTWTGVDRAKRDFENGILFVYSDGSEGEPFGIKVK